MMLAGLLATLLGASALQEETRPPRPSDSELLASVQAEVPVGRILSSTFEPTPRDGGYVGCGLIDIAGVVEPFSVLTLWKRADTNPVVLSQITVPGPDGRPVTHDIPPKPPEPAGWRVNVSAPRHQDVGGDGRDRHDRNIDTLSRRMALLLCPDLRPPAGLGWTVDIEPDPDPVRAERNRRRAQAATELIFGPASEAQPPAAQTER